MNNINYQKKLDLIVREIREKKCNDKLLLHSCCAPCSSYILKYLFQYFKIDIFYYNPNIYPENEYFKRIEEQKRLVSLMNLDENINIIDGSYNVYDFYNEIKGLENLPEGQERCYRCYNLRLKKTAQLAQRNGYDYFTTTLTISPYKNAVEINKIGESLEKEYGVKYLYSDFKKRNGYKESIELSKKYNLYRQKYCGCVFSIRS